MSKQMVKNLKEGDFVSSMFQIDNLQLFENKNKSGYYLFLLLSDKTGGIKGVCWEKGDKILATLENGCIANVAGRVQPYNNQLQVNIDKISLTADDEYSALDFLPVSKANIETLFQYITNVIQNIKNPYLKKLLIAFFEDKDFVSKFKSAPAAKSIHHSYLGGLIEHTTNCLKLAVLLCELYPELRKDLLLVGVLLHDIGKLEELSFDTKIDYSDSGRLLGHITIGTEIVAEKISSLPKFPNTLRIELLHLILSHHGDNATGSPKRPKTLEACALHFLDNLEAQVKRFTQIIENIPQQHKKKKWSTYDKLLDRYIFVGYEEEDFAREEF